MTVNLTVNTIGTAFALYTLELTFHLLKGYKMKTLTMIALMLMTSVAQAGDYKIVNKNSKKLLNKYEYVVKFKEPWIYSPSSKKWISKEGRKLTNRELLSQKEITLKPAGSVKISSPFVYVWDNEKKKVRIICTGFGMKHKGIK